MLYTLDSDLKIKLPCLNYKLLLIRWNYCSLVPAQKLSQINSKFWIDEIFFSRWVEEKKWKSIQDASNTLQQCHFNMKGKLILT